MPNRFGFESVRWWRSAGSPCCDHLIELGKEELKKVVVRELRCTIGNFLPLFHAGKVIRVQENDASESKEYSDYRHVRTDDLEPVGIRYLSPD